MNARFCLPSFSMKDACAMVGCVGLTGHEWYMLNKIAIEGRFGDATVVSIQFSHHPMGPDLCASMANDLSDIYIMRGVHNVADFDAVFSGAYSPLEWRGQ